MSKSVNLILRISDEGPGIENEDLEKVFEPFEQLSEINNVGGVGLGLSISRELAHSIGGSVNLFNNENGKGATFELRIPVQVVTGELVLPRKSNSGGELEKERNALLNDCDGEALTTTTKKVLLVEDDVVHRIVMERLIESIMPNCELATFESAVSALQYIETHKYDLLISDVHMPVLSGVELCKILKGRRDAVHAIAISAAVDQQSRFDVRQVFDQYLSKPVSSLELQHALQEWMKSIQVDT